MSPTVTKTAMPDLPRPGHKVCWRNPAQARACGWEAVFGPGPYMVVRSVDHSAHGLAAGLVLRTAMGDQEVSEVWLTLADEPEGDGGAGRLVAVGATGSPAIPHKEVAQCNS